MKKLINTGATVVTLSLLGCGSVPQKTSHQFGRMIEFKSDANGFDTRTYFYEGTHEVVAFDSQFTPELATQSIAYLRQFTQKPITWLIITHPNPDKFNGTAVFKKEGAKILASSATARSIPEVHAYKEYYFVTMAKMFKKGEYPVPASVDKTFERDMELVLKSGERIQLRELSQPGVSSNQTVVYIPSINSLVVGDLIHHKAHAWLEGGIVKGKATPNIEGWINGLKELTQLYPSNAAVYGGRGVTQNLDSSVREQIDYLKTAQNIIRQTIKAQKITLQDFATNNLGDFYRVLVEKFQKQFPDYSYPYMIEYGAYGLVQSELMRESNTN